MTPVQAPALPVQTTSSLPYVLPFIVFLAFLGVTPQLQFLGTWEYATRVVILSAVLWFFSRHVISFSVSSFLPTVTVGVAVFVLWIAPDALFPGYRDHWLFQNAVTGTLSSSMDVEHRGDAGVLIFRGIRAIVLVPIIEELFWRAWLMRWLISPRFDAIPLGSWTPYSMTVTALLFATEHGPYWDVGLVTGFIYNWWMVRTRSLGDCILAHAVTNGCLSAYVVLSGRWEYWM